MDWAGAFEKVNFLSVLIAGLSSFIVGGLWYSKRMFMNAWIKESGTSKKDIQSKEGMTQIFVGMFLLSLFTAYFLAVLIYMVAGETASWLDGSIFGAVVGIAFVAATLGTHILFERKTLKSFALQAGHDVLKIIVMGAIIAGMGF
jgi:hypothetical protein